MEEEAGFKLMELLFHNAGNTFGVVTCESREGWIYSLLSFQIMQRGGMSHCFFLK